MAWPTSPRLSASCAALILATACATLVGLVSAAPNTPPTVTIQVRPGQRIQAAIDAASAGNRIVVAAGTYAEQLTITKDGIALVGQGAILVPPQAPLALSIQNTCTGLAGPGTIAGICVSGSNVQLAPFVEEHRKVISVGQTVKDVSITGFDIRNFSGENIAVVGGQNTIVTGNTLYNGSQYGLLTAGSTSTQFTKNVVRAPTLQFIAICADDLGGSQVVANTVSGYAIGLCVQTPGEIVQSNDVSNCCYGIFVDPFVTGAQVLPNHVSGANTACGPALGSAFGIAVAGAVNTAVRANLVEGVTLGNLPNVIAAGIAVFDNNQTMPIAVATGNSITQNVLRNNFVDLGIATTGAGNVVQGNTCTTPAALCT